MIVADEQKVSDLLLGKPAGGHLGSLALSEREEISRVVGSAVTLTSGRHA
jgi:hypothetical protein